MESIADKNDERLSTISVWSYAEQAEVCGPCHEIREDEDGN
jgi:hypothetical protein